MGDGHSRRRFLATAASAAVAFVIAGCTSQKDQSGRTSASGDDTVESFGGRITAGPIDHIKRSIEATQAPYYVAPARAYVSAFPEAQLAGARASYPSEVRAALDAGVVVLYQRCTHLGCRVPYCPSSQWFECPCHGAKFDGVGEYRAGPAPRGLDLMAASVERGNLVIDTATIVPGMPQGTDTTHQDPAGQFCVFF